MPYILNTEKDTKEMLHRVGVDSFSGLYASLPEEVKLKKPLNLPAGLSEHQVRRKISAAAEKNTPIEEFNSFLGAGVYDHYLPSALKFIVSQPQFVTAYTPYQAESSQGILQAIYEYQSYMCFLTGMDVSNASVFDGASSLAEAVLMSLRITKRKKVVISQTVHPQYRDVLRTYLGGLDLGIEEAGSNRDGFIDEDVLAQTLDKETACFAFASPNFFGLIENPAAFSSIVKEKGALLIMAANPVSLVILKEPTHWGIDIVCGDGQVLGQDLSLGGPSFGFLTTKDDYLRQLPGRIVGKTKDVTGQDAYCLTLQAREQHIRREKSTSNICSNQSLNAIKAAVYLSLMGKEGMKQVALYSFNLAHYLYDRLAEIEEVKLIYGRRFFCEFVWEVAQAKRVVSKLYKRGIIAGFYLGGVYPQFPHAVLSCCTEKKSREDIDSFIAALKEEIRNG